MTISINADDWPLHKYLQRIWLLNQIKNKLRKIKTYPINDNLKNKITFFHFHIQFFNNKDRFLKIIAVVATLLKVSNKI